MDRAGNFLPPYSPTRPFALALTALLLTLAGLCSLSAGFEISEIRLLSTVIGEGTITAKERWSHSLTRQILLFARGALVVSTAALFIVWLYLSRINVRALGSRRFTYSRNWVFWSFAIPIVNLIRPLQIVREVWRSSDPRSSETPLAWKTMPVPDFVTTWWAMLIGCGVLQLLGAALTTSNGATIELLRVARGVTAIADITTSLAAGLGYFVVQGITAGQEAKWSVLCGNTRLGDHSEVEVESGPPISHETVHANPA